MPRSQPLRADSGKNHEAPLATGKSMLWRPARFCASAPTSRLGRALGKAWPPTKRSLASPAAHPQLDLLPGHGQLILHSPVVLGQGPQTKDRHLFLFQDWLVVAKQRSSKDYRVKQKLLLSHVGVVFCDQEKRQDEDGDQELVPGGNVLYFMLASSLCVTQFPSPEVKEVWLEALRRSGPGHSGVKFTSAQSARLLMKLISSCDVSKTLSASDMETLNECQSELDIKKHPLLVSCDSEDSICQLIDVKKRKKVSSWLFLRKKLSSSSEFPEAELKVSLFDQPLSVICRDDNSLPKPIQDILTILCLKGPSTEGIFRKAANEKARKELTKELNSGADVDLESLPVHLLAVVFKDFLRSIPQKLLSCDLFEEWMEALEKESEEDRIEALKLVAEKLPGPNLWLLKHLMHVLYLVSKNADASKMDASNLAICIGPNMLAREQDQSLPLEAQKDLNGKVKTLVEFLIDNCLEIFENIPAHSSTTSDDSLEHTDGSDTSVLQNDSAYDSNDPDGEPSSAASSPSGPLKTPEPESGALQQAWESNQGHLVSSVARLKSALGQADRSYSEPSMSLSQAGQDSPPLTGSQGDFASTLADSQFANEDAGDPFPEDVFPALESRSSRPRDLRLKKPALGLASKAASRGSLDGSPHRSPSSPQRGLFGRHRSFTKMERTKPGREIKKHSLSFSFASHQRVLTKAASVGSVRARGLTGDEGKKGLRKDSQLAGRIVQEGTARAPCPSVTDFPCRAQAFSAEDVFRYVDQRSPGSPPSYQEAIRCQGPSPTAYGSQTVDSMRARLLSLDTLPSHHREDPGQLCGLGSPNGHSLCHRTEAWHQGRTVCAPVETTGQAASTLRPELRRLQTDSELWQKTERDFLARRCSPSVLEADQLLYAKESYI